MKIHNLFYALITVVFCSLAVSQIQGELPKVDRDVVR